MYKRITKIITSRLEKKLKKINLENKQDLEANTLRQIAYIEMHFATALEQTVNVVVYVEFEAVLEIDKGRNIMLISHSGE